LKRGAAHEPYTLAEIAERDGYCCKLCGVQVLMDLRCPELMAPTIDHIVPISLGGDDTPANVQLAHFTCNSRKGARVLELAV
jgi:5-methylcytosine-specific restriction endonuclease McrA